MEDLVKQLSEKADEIFQQNLGLCRIKLFRLKDGVYCTLEYSDSNFNFKMEGNKAMGSGKVDLGEDI